MSIKQENYRRLLKENGDDLSGQWVSEVMRAKDALLKQVSDLDTLLDCLADMYNSGLTIDIHYAALSEAKEYIDLLQKTTLEKFRKTREHLEE